MCFTSAKECRMCLEKRKGRKREMGKKLNINLFLGHAKFLPSTTIKINENVDEGILIYAAI